MKTRAINGTAGPAARRAASRTISTRTVPMTTSVVPKLPARLRMVVEFAKIHTQMATETTIRSTSGRDILPSGDRFLEKG